MSESEYTPGTYVKGDSERVANSTSEAVALRFEGYRLKRDADAPVEAEESDDQPSAQPDAVAPGAPARSTFFDDED